MRGRFSTLAHCGGNRSVLLALGVGLWIGTLGCSSSSFSMDPGADIGTVDSGRVDSAAADSSLDSTAGDTQVADTALEALTPDETGPILGVCKTKKEGEACTIAGLTGRFCIGGECVPSRCGDGIVDTSAGEECDSKTEVGCESTSCRFKCTSDTICNDFNECTTDKCNLAQHVCENTPVADTPVVKCSLVDTTIGVCRVGTCSPVNCGDGKKELTEECDDGNKIDHDGCDNDCHFSCKSDADCIDSNVCNGGEKCVKNVCVPGTPLRCDPKDCSDVKCDEIAGCVYTKIDKDGDGQSVCEGDCDDSNKDKYKGAPQRCGGDFNCDGKPDSIVTGTLTCYRDGDGDGFGSSATTTVPCSCGSCACPGGYVSRSEPLDCNDNEGGARPGNISCYPTPYLTPDGGKSFDWDCNGVATPCLVYPILDCETRSTAATCPSSTKSWVRTQPGCGQPGYFTNGCSWDSVNGKCKFNLFGSPTVQQCK